jgi:hypothetical protein
VEGPGRAPVPSARGRALCAGCLALALRISLEEVREVMRGVDGEAGLQVMAVTCGSLYTGHRRALHLACVGPTRGVSRRKA